MLNPYKKEIRSSKLLKMDLLFPFLFLVIPPFSGESRLSFSSLIGKSKRSEQEFSQRIFAFPSPVPALLFLFSPSIKENEGIFPKWRFLQSRGQAVLNSETSFP
ncbi:hypothetical protein [Allobaculum fili]|uniref:hypothetical protein n=1 Tax=Allobaculum fili TaxID=2834460 RepID=UPI001E4F8099|nr:hypothetical protein [Allobaculum fili]